MIHCERGVDRNIRNIMERSFPGLFQAKASVRFSSLAMRARVLLELGSNETLAGGFHDNLSCFWCSIRLKATNRRNSSAPKYCELHLFQNLQYCCLFIFSYCHYHYHLSLFLYLLHFHYHLYSSFHSSILSFLSFKSLSSFTSFIFTFLHHSDPV